MTHEEKECRTCKRSLPDTLEFFHGDGFGGRRHQCKPCASVDSTKVRLRNIDKFLERERARHKKRYALNLCGERDRVDSACKTPKGKARKKVRNFVASGKLKKPSNCSRCGKTGRIHGHHPDYSKPLDVIWLCPACHAQEHRKEQA